MNDYMRSLLRFWWVLLLGVLVAFSAAVLAVFSVDFSSSPPQLTERTQPKYSAQGRLLVTHSSQPHLRTAQTTEQAVAADAEGQLRTLPVTSAPDTATLVQAANLYPSIIESDQVTAIREQTFGVTDGQLRAQALYAVATPSRFTPSRVPVIQLVAVADSAQDAMSLVSNTSEAFIEYVRRSQRAAGIRPVQRIQIVPLQTPKTAAAFGGASSTLPVLVFGVVLMAFAALALLLDRAFPRPRVEAAVAAAEPAHERVHTTA